jgi:hypothetical protein
MWTKEQPKKEGWYFWKKTKAQHDPWKYHAYFVTEDGECWENGTQVCWPVGGHWKPNCTYLGA